MCMLLAGISCGGGVEQHKPTYLTGRDWVQESKSHHGKWVPFSLYLHIGTETPSIQGGDLLCFKILAYIVLVNKCIEQSVSYPKEYLFCFALLCFRQARLEFCCRGFWSLSYWISSYFVKFINRQQSKKCNLSKNIVLFIKEIRLECLFLIILLGLQKHKLIDCIIQVSDAGLLAKDMWYIQWSGRCFIETVSEVS